MKRSPVLDPSVAEWYAKNYYDVEDEVLPVFERLDVEVLDRYIEPGMKIFDAMMGRGRGLLRYADRCDATGNDLNRHMVAWVRKAAKAIGVKIRLLNQDVRRLDIPDGTFDLSFAMYSSIGTMPGKKKRQEAFDEIARVTKRGGRVIVHAHNRLDAFVKPAFAKWGWGNFLRPEKGLERGDLIMCYNGLDEMMNHMYMPSEFKRSFRKAGLRIEKMFYMSYKDVRFIKGPFKGWRAEGFIVVARKP